MRDRITHTALVIAALAAAGLNIAAPATAGATIPERAGTASAAVSHADLNLATPAGVSKLEARVRRAAERLCADAGVRPLHLVASSRACVDEAVAASGAQLRSAILQASQGSGAGAQ